MSLTPILSIFVPDMGSCEVIIRFGISVGVSVRCAAGVCVGVAEGVDNSLGIEISCLSAWPY